MFDFYSCRPDLQTHFQHDPSAVEKIVEAPQIPNSTLTFDYPCMEPCPYTMSEEEIIKRTDEYLQNVYCKRDVESAHWGDVSTMSELPHLEAMEMDEDTSDEEVTWVESPTKVALKVWDFGNHPLLLAQRAAHCRGADEPEGLRHEAAEKHMIVSALRRRSSAKAAAHHMIRSVLAGVLHRKSMLVKGAMRATRSTQMLLGSAEPSMMLHLDNISTADTMLRRASVKAETFRVLRAAYAGYAESQTQKIQTAAFAAALKHLDEEPRRSPERGIPRDS